MRIAVSVIGLAIFLLLIPLSCVGVTSAAFESSFQFLPMLIPFCIAVGSGFVIRLPLLSMVVFLITAILAATMIILGGEKTDKLDLWIGIAVYALPPYILAIMSYFGYLELKRQDYY